MPGVRLSGRSTDTESIPLRIDGPGRLDGRIRMSEADDDLVFRIRGRIAGRGIFAPRVRPSAGEQHAFRDKGPGR